MLSIFPLVQSCNIVLNSTNYNFKNFKLNKLAKLFRKTEIVTFVINPSSLNGQILYLPQCWWISYQ